MDNDVDIFVRELELESCEVLLKFHQKKVGNVSCIIWDAALVLAKYLDYTNRKSNWLKGKKVLELGAGVGCAGLTAACLGADVILTDLEDALPLLETNIKLNKYLWSSKGNVKAQVLEWGKDTNLEFKPEIILLTDCVYYEESIKPLLDTLESLCNNEDGTYAILSQEERDTPKQSAIWIQFFTELNQRFKVETVPLAEQHPTFSSTDIHLLKISRV